MSRSANVGTPITRAGTMTSDSGARTDTAIERLPSLTADAAGGLGWAATDSQAPEDGIPPTGPAAAEAEMGAKVPPDGEGASVGAGTDESR